MSELDTAIVAILDRLESCQRRLASAADETAARARTHAAGSSDPRSAMAFHQCGALEQVCRNEAAALEVHIKLLRSATAS